MKVNVLMIVFYVFSKGLFGQVLQFSDIELKQYLINENCLDVNNNGIGDVSLDSNNDNEIQYSEALVAESMEIAVNSFSYNILSLADLSLFTELNSLSISAPIIDVGFSSNSLQKLSIGDCSVKYIDISEIPNLIDTRFEGLELVYLNIKNGSFSPYFSLFYSTVDSLICIDPIQEEYDDILGWTVDESKITYDCSSNSLDETMSFKSTVYPNPVDSELYIDVVASMKDVQYYIFNIAGQKKLQGVASGNKISTADLDSGIYYIHLVSDNDFWIHQFIKR